MPAWRTSVVDGSNDEPLIARAELERDLDVDVAIIGRRLHRAVDGYYLKKHATGLNIAIIEAQTPGLAHGRNGGWLMGNLLGEDRLLAGLSPEHARVV